MFTIKTPSSLGLRRGEEDFNLKTSQGNILIGGTKLARFARKRNKNGVFNSNPPPSKRYFYQIGIPIRWTLKRMFLVEFN